MINLVNGIPEKLVEMDEQITFTRQMDDDAGPVLQINKFNVTSEEAGVLPLFYYLLPAKLQLFFVCLS